MGEVRRVLVENSVAAFEASVRNAAAHDTPSFPGYLQLDRRTLCSSRHFLDPDPYLWGFPLRWQGEEGNPHSCPDWHTHYFFWNSQTIQYLLYFCICCCICICLGYLFVVFLIRIHSFICFGGWLFEFQGFPLQPVS